MHKYCEMVAKELENMGFTMQEVVRRVDMIEITPTTRSVKEIVWKPIEEATLGKKSTTELSTSEVDAIYQVMSMFLSKQFQISLPFPTYQDLIDYEKET